jgi:cyanophycinase
VEQFTQLFQGWESDAVNTLPIFARRDAQQTEHVAQIEQATAILILDSDPRQLARTLGGTPVAQAIRRANARGKVVGGVGMAGSVLCQHMALFDSGESADSHYPVRFAPGLGLVNRMTINLAASDEYGGNASLRRLLSAIADNPFLVGVSIGQNSGVAIYPDTTLEVFGLESALVIDGLGLSESPLPVTASVDELQALGIHLYELAPGATYNFDQRRVASPPADLPLTALPAEHKSSL